MEYKRLGDKIVARLDKGEDINEEILKIAEREEIAFGCVSGIGATDDFTVGVFNLEKSDYETYRYTGNHEITALSGNISTKDGLPYVHLHISCGNKNGELVGGHLLKSRISLTCEIMIVIADIKADRKFDEEIGINRITLS
ncbi:MAG: DNA-binding protein [Oscillospiraceae bacterium]|nr:DNA-binding protein [Candidatus Ruminococcus equi]